MKITSFAIGRPDQPFLATFGLRLNDDIAMCGLLLRERPDGTKYVASPRLGTGNFASMSAAIRVRILKLVVPLYDHVLSQTDEPIVIAAG